MTAAVASRPPQLVPSQAAILCGPPRPLGDVYDPIFLKVYRQYGRGYAVREFALSGVAKDRYAGKVLANFDVIIRWSHRHLKVTVDPAEPQWHLRMRTRFAQILTKATNAESPIDPRRVRIEDRRQPQGSTRIDESEKGLEMLLALSVLELRLVVLDPPGEGRLEPLTEAPSYKFPEPVRPLPGTIDSCSKQDAALSFAETSAMQLRSALVSTMVPIAVRTVRMREAAPKGLDATYEKVLNDMYTAPVGANAAPMDSTGTLHVCLAGASCPDQAATSNELALSYARKICKLVSLSQGSSDQQIELFVKKACDPIAAKFHQRALDWGTRMAPRLECPDPVPSADNMGTSLPAKLHTVCAPIGEPLVEHIEQRLISASFEDPYRRSLGFGGASPSEALNGTRNSVFDDRDRLAGYALDSAKKRNAYMASNARAVDDVAMLRATVAAASAIQSAARAPPTGAVRTMVLGGREMLRVDPIEARLMGRKTETQQQVQPWPGQTPTLVSFPESDPGVLKLREIQCSHCQPMPPLAADNCLHCNAATEVLATVSDVANVIIPEGLPTDLPIIECRFCNHGSVPSSKSSKAEEAEVVSVSASDEVDDAETPVSVNVTTTETDAPEPTPEGPTPVPAPAEPEPTPAPAAPTSLMEFTEAPAPAPTAPTAPVVEAPAEPLYSTAGEPVPLPPVSRFNPPAAAAVRKPLPPYPAHGMTVVRGVNASNKDVRFVIEKKGAEVLSLGVPANTYVDSSAFPNGIYVVRVTDETGRDLVKTNAYRFTQRNLHALDYTAEGKVEARLIHLYATNKIRPVDWFFGRFFRRGAQDGPFRASTDTGIYILPVGGSAARDQLSHIHIKATPEEAQQFMGRTFEDDGMFTGGSKTVYSSFEVPASRTNIGLPLRITRDELNSRIAVTTPDGTSDWAKIDSTFRVTEKMADTGHGSFVMSVHAPIDHVISAAKM